MNMKGLGLGGFFAVVALVGCGSSGGSSQTGGSTGTGGGSATGLAGSTGSAGSTGTGGGSATGHAGSTGSAGSTGTGGGSATGLAGSTGTAGSGSAGHAGSGGTSGNGGAFTTSVPAGTKLTGLTSAQSTQLCNDIEKYFDDTLVPDLCNATASSSVKGLEAAYSDLIENSSATDAELRADCTAANSDAGSCPLSNRDGGSEVCDTSSVPSSCEATVGDYSKCLNDTNTSVVQYYASLPSCSSITAASVTAFFAADGGLSSGPPEPTSCAMFDSTCSDDDGGTAAMTNMSPLPMPTGSR